MAFEVLRKALDKRERDYSDALDKLFVRAADAVIDEEEILVAHQALREAIFLVRVLRHLTLNSTLKQVYDAYGAPGDFGYDTPIGDALARTYASGGA